MTEPVLRNGAWWAERDGRWHRWNEGNQEWELKDTPPPPLPLETSGSPSPTPALLPQRAMSSAVSTAREASSMQDLKPPFVSWIQQRPWLLWTALGMVVVSLIADLGLHQPGIAGLLIGLLVVGLLGMHFALIFWLTQQGRHGWAIAIFFAFFWADIAYIVYYFVMKRQRTARP